MFSTPTHCTSLTTYLLENMFNWIRYTWQNCFTCTVYPKNIQCIVKTRFYCIVKFCRAVLHSMFLTKSVFKFHILLPNLVQTHIHRTTETHTLCNPILQIFSGSDRCNLNLFAIWHAIWKRFISKRLRPVPPGLGGGFGSLGNAPWGIAVWGILRSKMGWEAIEGSKLGSGRSKGWCGDPRGSREGSAGTSSQLGLNMGPTWIE